MEWKIFFAYWLVINLVAMIMYISDKRKAQNGKWRTTEFALIFVSWIGGSVGALIGMYVFRHKTRHIKFQILVPMSFLIHLAALIYFVFYF